MTLDEARKVIGCGQKHKEASPAGQDYEFHHGVARNWCGDCDCCLQLLLAAARSEANAEIDRLRVQLAGCGAAIFGHVKPPLQEGAYGWSVAYQDAVKLFLKHETLETAAYNLLEQWGSNLTEEERASPLWDALRVALKAHIDFMDTYVKPFRPPAQENKEGSSG